MQYPVIGIVGPCAAGKSTLINNLANLGITAKHIAQEHSFVPAMWERLSSPDVLIFLDITFEESMKRRKQNWGIEDYQEQQHRLRHARQYAHLYLDTTSLNPMQVLECVLKFLDEYDKTTQE
jgi:deoxyadenosine/deoxycytidine kinase